MKKVLIAGNNTACANLILSIYPDVEVSYIENNDDLEREYLEYKTTNVRPDLIVFTGGPDVNPIYYSQNKGKYTVVDKSRDIMDFNISDYFPHNIPKLGICRGGQFLTVKAGGDLIQHVNNHHIPHNIQTDEGQTFRMTSTHHQMFYPINIDHTLLAWSKFFQSTTYLDGANKEIDIPADFLEPEIVYYPKINGLAIQGHPEFDDCPKETVEYCKSLIKSLVEGTL